MIKLIVCTSKYNGIGLNGSIPWYLPEDLAFFKQHTLNNVVIMGKNTFDSLPDSVKPLPNRSNVVISSTYYNNQSNRLSLLKQGVQVFPSLTDALKLYKFSTVFIIGGQQLYQEALHLNIVDEIILTKIYHTFPTDRFLPDFKSDFVLHSTSEKFLSSTNLVFRHFTYLKKSQEFNYLNILQHVLFNGINRSDRTNVGTLSVFGSQMRFDLKNSFPLLTTKRVPFQSVLKELLWLVKGDTNSKHLQDQGVNIWNGNTTREFLDNRGLTHLPEGDIGEMYGHQWRHWGSTYTNCTADYSNQGIDQLQQVIDEIKSNPTSRRLIVTALNPSSYNNSCLLPCHTTFQFYVDTTKNTLSCHLYQRSGDLFLGIPFNIASYSILTYMVAKICNLQPGEFIHTIGDSHVYLNHVEQVNLQLSRNPKPFPTLSLKNRSYDSIDDFTLQDFELSNYNPHPSIKAPMAI